MWWLNSQMSNDDAQIEINLAELQNFIMQEAVFIKELEELVDKTLDWKNLAQGKTPWLLYDFWTKLATHLYELVQYFAPKEVES